MLLPRKVVAAARTEIGNEKRRVGGVLLYGQLFQTACLFLQAAFAFGHDFGRFQAAEIQFVDDRQNVDFKEHGWIIGPSMRMFRRPFSSLQ